MKRASPPSMVFINQSMALPFLNLLKAIVKSFGTGRLYTGSFKTQRNENLEIRQMPPYCFDNIFWRIWTWFAFGLRTFLDCLLTPGKPFVFAVSNPPITLWLAYVLYRLRGWSYALLVWDIYPDLIILQGFLTEKNMVTRFWRYLNRLTISNAEFVVTSGDFMAATIEKQMGGFPLKRPIVVIPNWVDTDFIKPMPKDENWFAKKYNQLGKTTILYSGTMGVKHDMETMLEAAHQLQHREDLHFMFIGDGTRRPYIERQVSERGMNNVTILPWQPDEILPYSMACGDIALVSLDAGMEGLAMPSKTYFLMASGNALIGISTGPDDLYATIEKHHCGLSVRPGNVEDLVNAILTIGASLSLLQEYKNKSRQAAEVFYSAKVCENDFLVHFSTVLTTNSLRMATL